MTADHYLSMCASIRSEGEPKSFEVRLGDGRTINVHHRPLPDGAWIAYYAIRDGRPGVLKAKVGANAPADVLTYAVGHAHLHNILDKLCVFRSLNLALCTIHLNIRVPM